MIGIYFSGTGNTRYCVEKFVQECSPGAKSCAIEDTKAVELIKIHDEIVFGYSVQFSNIPKMVRDFICQNQGLWKGKKIFVIATMGLFSGDGTGMSARLFQKYGAEITGGLHLKMPDSIGDEKALKKPLKKNRELVKLAGEKIGKAAYGYKSGNSTRDGLGLLSHLAGLFGQRLYFFWKTKEYTDKLKIDEEKCVACSVCVKLCPMGNITMKDDKAVSGGKCTMCYRCISNCPKQAITLLGKNVYEQCRIENYL